jgi:glycosyltransferase involved in cell wall biosynthesis
MIKQIKRSDQTPMKILVFAHIPPPHHGQSYMVKLMLEGLGGDKSKHTCAAMHYGISCFHVNARVSKKLEDVGNFRIGKILLLLIYCFRAIWLRFRFRIDTFYYIPAPGKRSAVYRDWIVLFICRPFFKRIIFHWHSAGMGAWVDTAADKLTRTITYHILKNADLSVVLSQYNREDAARFFPKRVEIVNNGIPDPCPDFEHAVLPRRQIRRQMIARLIAGQKLTSEEQAGADNPEVFRVLYLAHCMREKGVFDAIAGVQLANQRLAKQNSPISIQLLVAGSFVSAEEWAEFTRIQSQSTNPGSVQYLGFVSGEQKMKALRNADLFCFPTYFQNENQPVNLIEAMAFGLPIVTTQWRSLPEMLLPQYPGIVDIRSPEKIADAIIASLTIDGASLRNVFLRSFTIEAHLYALSKAFHLIEKEF